MAISCIKSTNHSQFLFLKSCKIITRVLNAEPNLTDHAMSGPILDIIMENVVSQDVDRASAAVEVLSNFTVSNDPNMLDRIVMSGFFDKICQVLNSTNGADIKIALWGLSNMLC
jgi:hypothetical protein